MAKSKGQHFLHVGATASFIAAIRAHAKASGETMSAFMRRMVRAGIAATTAAGTIHTPDAES
jgi:hypothetical protein